VLWGINLLGVGSSLLLSLQVSMVDRSPRDEVMVLASDGLWDVVSNQEAADVALHTLAAAGPAPVTSEGVHVRNGAVAATKRAAGALTGMALERGTRDNVTVLVVDLRRG